MADGGDRPETDITDPIPYGRVEHGVEHPQLIGGGTGIVNWMFRSRKTGRVTVAQLPNWPLAAWFLASVVTWLGHPQGWTRAFLVVLSSAALTLWAGDELLRGVNPFRRLVGLATLGWLVYSLLRLG